jgi:hypothetical protein
MNVNKIKGLFFIFPALIMFIFAVAFFGTLLYSSTEVAIDIIKPPSFLTFWSVFWIFVAFLITGTISVCFLFKGLDLLFPRNKSFYSRFSK